MFGDARAGSEGEAPEQAERRPRRRRSRRGRKRRDTEAGVGETSVGEASAGAADEPADAPTGYASEELPEMQREMTEADELADDGIDLEEGEEGEGQQSPRIGFRGIPTWEEAVGLIVNKNIETRAKRPSSGSQHSRGRRGPPDNRGGRGGKRCPS